jgi:hypothetical protein
VRVTKVAAMPGCAICERTLLMGERAVRFAPEEGAELVDVCPLCHDIALEHGWIKEGTPTTPTIPGDRRRRRRGLGDLLGLGRGHPTDTIAPPEPILRRLSDEEVALLEAADLFNASTYRRTLGGIARSLGEAKASIVPLPGISRGTSTGSARSRRSRSGSNGAATSSTSSRTRSRPGTRASRTKGAWFRRSRASSRARPDGRPHRDPEAA